MNELKDLRRRRADLCDSRRVWECKVPNVLHIDYTLTCAHTKIDPPQCEGCCSKLHRADRLTEIAAGIKAVDVEITAITDTPYGTAKPEKPVQLTLF